MLTMLQPTHALQGVFAVVSKFGKHDLDAAFCLEPRFLVDGVARFLVEGLAMWPGGSVGCDPYTMGRPLYYGLAQVWT